MSTKKTIATIIGVLLMFGCQFLPPVFGLTPLGMQVAGIFIGTILLWTSGCFWPGDSIFSPYCWFDLLLAGCLLALLPATGKAVQE